MDKPDDKPIEDGCALGADVQIPESVRPAGFDKYVGQTNVVEIVKLKINAALRRREPLGHMVFTGPHGLGKTTLAGIIAEIVKQKFGGDFISISGKEITTKTQIHEMLLDLNPMSIIFCDELHNLPPGIQDLLHKPLEEFKLDIIIERKIHTETLVPFTFIGATTNENKITAPLLSRLYELHFDLYTEQDLSTIIRNSAQILNIPIDNQGAMEIARRSQDTPRTANLLLLWARDFAEERAQGRVTLEVARAAGDMLRIDKIGITEMGRKYMSMLLKQRKGRPVGVNNLAASLSTNKGILEERVEPFLKRRGLIEVVHGGRRATEDGYEYYGVELPRDRR
jgi:holliday junction DNA helicase RuvB